MNFLSLDKAVAADAATVSTVGKVITKTEPTSYTNKAGESRTYFTITIADKTAYTTVRIYNKNLNNRIQPNETYGFINLLKKSDLQHPLWAIVNTQVIAWTPLRDIPEEIVTEATNPASSKSERTLTEALKSANTSTVCGKVVQVYICYRQFLNLGIL